MARAASDGGSAPSCSDAEVTSVAPTIHELHPGDGQLSAFLGSFDGLPSVGLSI
jgi:hypothetical protein